MTSGSSSDSLDSSSSVGGGGGLYETLYVGTYGCPAAAADTVGVFGPPRPGRTLPLGSRQVATDICLKLYLFLIASRLAADMV